MTTVLVLGGYGAVGRHVVSGLRAMGDTALSAGRDPALADRVVDLSEPDLTSYLAAVGGTDVVVNAAGSEDPRLADRATRSGAAFVDVTATTGYVEELERLDPQRPVLVSVGLAPGLTNLLAASVHAATPGPIDLAVLLGAGEEHGAAATEWSYRLLGRHFDDHGRSTRNYTSPSVFELPGHGRRRLYRVDFADQHALSRDLGTRVRTYFGLDSRLATAALAVLTWLPGASRAPRGIHLPGSEDWLVLARGSTGTTSWARGRNQSRATGVVAATAAHRAAGLPPGVHHIHDVMSLGDVPRDQGIELHGR
jgi:saccharopine dehydrogenase-like NADP-dependent oxidoreductase